MLHVFYKTYRYVHNYIPDAVYDKLLRATQKYKKTSENVKHKLKAF